MYLSVLVERLPFVRNDVNRDIQQAMESRIRDKRQWDAQWGTGIIATPHKTPPGPLWKREQKAQKSQRQWISPGKQCLADAAGQVHL